MEYQESGAWSPEPDIITVMRVLTSEQMREADRRTINEIGIPGIVLMENAGRQIVSAMEAHIEGEGEKRLFQEFRI